MDHISLCDEAVLEHPFCLFGLKVSDPAASIQAGLHLFYGQVKMHRGDTLDGLPAAIRKMALSPAPPHRDEQFKKCLARGN